MSDQEFLHGAIHGSLLTVISKPHRGYWALLAAAWIWAIWSCAEYWRGNPNYSYGWIGLFSVGDSKRPFLGPVRYSKLDPNAPGLPFFQRNSGSRLISSGRTSNPTDRSK